MTAATITPIRGLSIQGEHQTARDQALAAASAAEVDAYVREADEAVLKCREAGHSFPTIREAGIRFDAETDTAGLFVRRLRCRSCRLVTRVEKWESVGRGRNRRYRKVGTGHLDYDQAYLLPAGMGTMRRRALVEALATQALAGVAPARARRAEANA